jgi:hypothetical protein
VDIAINPGGIGYNIIVFTIPFGGVTFDGAVADLKCEAPWNVVECIPGRPLTTFEVGGCNTGCGDHTIDIDGDSCL